MIQIENHKIIKEDFPVVNSVQVFRIYDPDKIYRIFKYWKEYDWLKLEDKKRNTTSYYERPNI